MSIFSWRKPDCPVGFREKAWVETRLRWLGEEFGTQRLTRSRVVLPTEDDFPVALDGTPEAAQRLLEQVCRYMEVPPAEIHLQVEPLEAAGATAPYAPGTICIIETQLANPVSLVSTLAHQVARHVLTQRKLLEGERDRPLVADLMTVIFGLGIFTANATIIERHERVGGRSWRSIGRQGYLPSRVTAYAMALCAWLSGDREVSWSGFLRDDAADAFRQGLRFLEATEDSLLRPDNLHSWDKNPSLRKLLGQIGENSPSQRVAALWELARREPTAEAVQAVADCLTDQRPGLRAEAIRALAEWGSAADPAVPAIIEALDDSDDEVRMAAACALGKLQLQSDVVVPELADRLERGEMTNTVAWALAQFQSAALSALPGLLVRLAGELGRGGGAMDYLTYAVRAIAPEPETAIKQLIESCDDDVQRQASALLPESGPIASPPGDTGLRYWASGWLDIV